MVSIATSRTISKHNLCARCDNSSRRVRGFLNLGTLLTCRIDLDLEEQEAVTDRYRVTWIFMGVVFITDRK